MIAKDTAARIWECYREMEMGNKLLADMKESATRYPSGVCKGTLKDAFGDHQHLQLGVPSGENCHRLFGVSPKLAATVIRAHIAAKQAELAEANEQARLELDEPAAGA